MTERYDYVIVGAGSAGCVLANRLSADPQVRVLLLEAGGAGTHPYLSIPLLARNLHGSPRFDWNFRSVENGLNGRTLATIAGKGLGGSSSINFLAFTRGAPGDFDRWAHDGATGWSWNDVLPYFRRLERWEGGASALRGANGPMPVIFAPKSDPLEDAVLAAASAAGHPITPDYNTQPVGFGRAQFTLADGRRASSARAYLRPARHRKNLTVRTNAHAIRIIFEGTTARSITYAHRSTATTAEAEREIVLCAGAIKSPQLLMLSGIGPADHLRAAGITPLVDLPVGDNLQNHLKVPLLWRRRPPVGPFHHLMRFDRIAPAVAAAYLFGRGPATVLPLGVQGFAITNPQADVPNLEFIVRTAPPAAAPWFPMLRAPYEEAFGIDPLLLHPQSRGTVRLRSADPTAPPQVHYDYLSAPADVVGLREGIRRARAIGLRRELDAYRGEELVPGDAVTSDAALDAHVRATAASMNHVVGTCRMGTDARAVVDPTLRVRGTTGLLVVDASIFPDLVSGHTNAAVMMVAERAADLIAAAATAAVDAALSAR
jgi:choline dehydrogenase-like flavoprotein